MTSILPGGTLGVLGGGQLGRMLSVEARRMGYRVCVLDPAQHCPAAQVADRHIHASFDDLHAAQELAAEVDVITVETELVPFTVLAYLEALKPVRPSANVLRLIQDRLVQKTFLAEREFPQTPYAAVADRRSLAEAVQLVGVPAILKSRRAGYDGKGQGKVERLDDLAIAWRHIGEAPAVLEAFVPFVMEVSIVLARGIDGQVCVYPAAENHHRQHILHTTRVPAQLSPEVQRRAEALAVSVAQALEYCGVMAVEFFLLQDETLLINEIAPRTHNSGHYTFGACVTSQFEQHLRAVCGLPLGDPSLLHPVVMVNLLGKHWRAGPPQWTAILAHPQARLYLYGKEPVSEGRKMGHVLLFDNDTNRALQLAEEILIHL